MRATPAVLLVFLAAGPRSEARQEGQVAPSREALEFFEKRIRPLLVDRCYSCHSAQAVKLKAGLRLDTREGLLRGGETGPALVPGHPEKSLLIRAVRRGDDDLDMPPDDKKSLNSQQIADVEAWIRMGAPDPRTESSSPAPAATGPSVSAVRGFWSFRPPVDPTLPPFRTSGWARTAVDAFLLARLEKEGLAPSPAADPRTLLRRLSFDLSGLPPSEEELAAFLADDDPGAWERAVDRLLASPRFGERWGRHWLDVARYADTKEWVVDEERRLPFPYTYRDWVIRAFNDDMPYDRFLTYQLAADRLVQGEDKTHLAALGFLTVGRSFLNRQPDIIDDQIDVVTRGTLGLSVQCARCHDHKYDPIPSGDYYSLYGIFASSSAPKELPLLETPRDSEDYRAYRKDLDAREGEISKFKEQKHAGVVAGFRKPETIADYLLAAQDAKALPEEGARSLARERKLNGFMLQRWVAFLRKTEASRDPVLAAWNAYAVLPAEGFVDRAHGIDLEAANPLVREAFTEIPGSLREVAQRYGTLLGAHDLPSPLDDPRREALRQTLCAPDAVTNMPVAEVDQFLTGEDRDKMKKLRRKVEEMHFHPGAPARAMTLEEGAPHEPRVFVRGNPATPGDAIPRRFLAILSPEERAPYATGGRLELAKAIASAENPLTARVWVNRVWLRLFGAGIVRTPSDFGTRGEPPTHPELLDWLACRFMGDGWSSKKLIRLLATSAAYRQSSADRGEARLKDPENRLLWRMNRRRLDLEAMRDALLAVSGQLDPAMGGRAVEITTEPYSRRRTVYGYVDRLNLANLFKTFDFALPDMHSPQRFTTTVPLQALFMMNSPFVHEQAEHLAARTALPGETPRQHVERLYRTVYGRAPSTEETELGLRFVAAQEARPDAAPATPVWQYGLARLDPRTERIVDFHPFPHYTGSAWQGGPKQPDPKLGWASIHAQGGHAGDLPGTLLVRRWTAPRDGKVSISGTAKHDSPGGDGVLARLVSSGSGPLASWTVCRLEAETAVSGLDVKQGETLDFAVDGRADNNSDSFLWAPVIRMKGPDEEWSAASGFGGPPPKALPPLSAWEKYAHVLLQSNEFMFLD